MIKFKTSWTNEQLEKLSLPSNHKITYDGFEYWWHHKINGNKWELHYINSTEDSSKYVKYLTYWLIRWSKELSERLKESVRDGMKVFNQELKITQTYVSISMMDKLTIQGKLDLMDETYRISYIDEVAKILKVTPAYVSNYLKKINLYR
jgi:hypothetical protein